MFIRFWFYSVRIGILGLVLLAVGMFARFSSTIGPWIYYLGLGITILTGIEGAICGAVLVFRNFEISCPVCSSKGKLAPLGNTQIGVDCKSCGFVYTKNRLLSFELVVDEHGSDEDG